MADKRHAKRDPATYFPKLPDKEWRARAEQAEAAIYNGACSYRQIAKRSGLTLGQVESIFKKFPEIRIKYIAKLQEVRQMASGNLIDIIKDKEDPNNFAATKYFLQRYKTELDEEFELRDDNGVSYDIGNKQSVPSLHITFESQKGDNSKD